MRLILIDLMITFLKRMQSTTPVADKIKKKILAAFSP
jgi:hypothetical protein